eukprot:8040379-Lingulodinium_polyedra.AAC.1
MLSALSDTKEEKDCFEQMASGLFKHTRDIMEPTERYQKALEAFAEAGAKKQRAERRAKEAQ